MSLKNQIKSYTSQVTKKEVTNFFVFMGGISMSNHNGLDATDISLVSKITKDETAMVIPRVNWNLNAEYDAYVFGSFGENSYCYNQESDMVYLCVGKNSPSGLIGETQIKSTEKPSHTSNIQTYSDGYSWLALYKIDFELSKFLTETVMPVNSLYDYSSQNISGSYSSVYNSLCGGGATSTGFCYFYYTKQTKDPVTSTVYQQGDLVEGIGTENWTCHTCHTTGEILGYKSLHVDENEIGSSITRTPFEELEQKISNNLLSTTDKYYVHYQNYDYVLGLQKGIQSLQLDVSSLSIEDRIVSTQNPTVTILDPLGEGATAKIQTFYDIRRNTFIANGITLLTSGSNYLNPSFRIADASSHALEQAIKSVVIPDISDPSTFLPNPKVSIVKNITLDDLENTYETNQVVFSKIGILSNVETTDGFNAAEGSALNEAKNGRTTTKILMTSTALAPQPINVDVSDVFIDNTTTDDTLYIKTTNDTATDQDYASSIVSIKEDISGDVTLEISGVDELMFDVLTSVSKINIDGQNYTRTSIEEPAYRIDNTEYVATRVLTNNLSFDKTTGADGLAKITFLI